ncbi:MAG TPA: (2Fe-2S) ferredoxin domain-containing protein [Candidatus Cloacimonetes bacterium]|jgi:NADP-reducing hydrogenase subunit HndB|nr:2Fe-2S ferredoxin [Candidatus Cloacimonas sp.]HHZ14673.1 (2Fe-2S) ferredoxin domain-containing protein [Candidatus Cloacimonadota bacterium]
MKTLADLKEIREQAKAKMKLRGSDARIKIVVGMGTSGIEKGARDITRTFLEEIATRNLIDVIVTQCGGDCKSPAPEPVVCIMEEGKETVTYANMTPDKARKVVADHVVDGKIVSEYVAN